MLNERAKVCYELYKRCDTYYQNTLAPVDLQRVEYLWGDQNIRRTTDDDQNDFVINIDYRDYITSKSMLARNVPSIELNPIIESLEETKDPLTRAINHVLRINDFIVRQNELLSFGLPLSRAYIKTTWDGSMRAGLGDIRIEVVDPRNIRMVPGISRLRNSLVVFEKKLVDKLTLLHMYPEQRDAIDKLFSLDVKEPNAGSPTFISDSNRIQYADVEGDPTSYFLSASASKSPEKPQIELVEAWFIDTTTLEQIPKMFDEFKKTAKYKSMKAADKERVGQTRLYPTGRLKVFSGYHEFEDRENPFPSLPYTEYINDPTPTAKVGDEFGMGEQDQIMELQDMLNTRHNQLNDALDHTAFGGFGITDSQVDTDEFESKPRRIYQFNRLGNFQWIAPPTIPAEAMRFTDDTFALANQIQNRHDIMSGETGQVRSGEAIEQLSDLANRTMITRTHALEACYRATARYIISMIGAFYRPGVHYSEDGPDLRGVSPDGYHIFVAAGLNLPASSQSAFVMLRQLAEMGVIDRLALLENVPPSILPNKDVVIDRMKVQWEAEKQAAQAKAEAEQNQMQSQAQANLASVTPMAQAGG